MFLTKTENLLDQQGGYSVSPNPNHGSFTIDLVEFHSQIEVTITNIAGQTIQTKSFSNVKTIEFSLNQPAGIYFVNVKTEEGKTGVTRVVKH